jgi:hypothetical protein
MPFLIFAEERELPYEMLVQLAQIMDESSEIALADATRQLHQAYDILHIPTADEAQRLVARFAALGVKSFALDALLEVPLPKLFHLQRPRHEGVIELAILGCMKIVTEHRQIIFNPLNAQVTYPNEMGMAIAHNTTETMTANQHDSHITIDIFTDTDHWRGQVEVFVAAQSFLKDLDLSNAMLSDGIRKLQAGEHHLPTFTDEHDYDRYVSWLFHLRYAPQGQRNTSNT